jgi:hypothetical protein
MMPPTPGEIGRMLKGGGDGAKREDADDVLLLLSKFG